MAGASRTVTIKAPIEKVWSVVTDYEKYPEFLAEQTTVKVKSRTGNVVEAVFGLKLMMEIKYTLRLTETAPTKMSWTMLEGQMMKSNEGGWTLEAISPTETRATYSIEVALKGLVPKSVSTGLIDSTLPKTMEAFKARAEKLA